MSVGVLNLAISRAARVTKVIGLSLCGCLFWATVQAEEGGGEKFNEGINYVPIKPPLVVNYGGVGKVRYIKAEISLRTEDAHSAGEVSHHMPLIKDTLIMLLSTMTLEQLSSGEGKEKMRVDALAKVNEVLTAAEHPAGEHHDDKKPAKDEHAKADKAKDEHGKKDDKAKEEHPSALVSDLLFDNLVVQK